MKTEVMKRRICSKVKIRDDGCWEWIGAMFKSGYGVLVVDGKHKRAHRVTYEAYKGPIPEGLEVCHSCNHKWCMNPDHLYIATHAQNMADAAASGRCFSPNGNAKLKKEQAEDIRKLYATGKYSYRELGEMFNTDFTNIGCIITNKTW